jgi:hypothetical protein
MVLQANDEEGTQLSQPNKTTVDALKREIRYLMKNNNLGFLAMMSFVAQNEKRNYSNKLCTMWDDI